jgi:hypothetical protein
MFGKSEQIVLAAVREVAEMSQQKRNQQGRSVEAAACRF